MSQIMGAVTLLMTYYNEQKDSVVLCKQGVRGSSPLLPTTGLATKLPPETGSGGFSMASGSGLGAVLGVV